MLTLAITLVCALLSWRLLFPPLAVILFLFLDPASTAGTAAAIPYSEYTCSMVWGGLLGGALTSILQLHKNRDNDDGAKFAWRIALLCLAMSLLIRISVVVCGHYYGASNDGVSVGPLTLIIVLAYLWDRRAWWCFGGMLAAQLGLSVYVILRPDTVFNGAFVNIESADEAERNLSSLLNTTQIVGARVPGQFKNTISMAIHATVGVAAGLALLVGSREFSARKKVMSVMAAGGLIMVGVYLLSVSASRGVMVGLAFGILVHFLNARGSMRFILLGIALFGVAFAGAQIVDMIPGDDPLWGRFAELQNYQETEDYRIEAMRSGVNAVLGSPVLGWGDFEVAYETVNGYMPHIGPYFMAILHGLPVGLLAALILTVAGWTDLTGKNLKELEIAPELRPLCAFATMSCWAAITAIFTNGYTTSSFLYILLGVAMWPMTSRPADKENELDSTTDEVVEIPTVSSILRDDQATVRN